MRNAAGAEALELHWETIAERQAAGYVELDIIGWAKLP